MAIIEDGNLLKLLDDRGRDDKDRMDLYNVLNRIDQDVNKAARLSAISVGEDPDTYRDQNNKYYTKDQIAFVVYDDIFIRPGFEYEDKKDKFETADTTRNLKFGELETATGNHKKLQSMTEAYLSISDENKRGMFDVLDYIPQATSSGITRVKNALEAYYLANNDFLMKQMAYQESYGNVVGVYKNNGDKSELISLAYLKGSSFIKEKTLLKSLVNVVATGATGAGVGTIASSIISKGNYLVDLATNATATKITTEIVKTFDSESKVLIEKINELCGSGNLDGADARTLEAAEQLQAVATGIGLVSKMNLISVIATGFADLASAWMKMTSQATNCEEAKNEFLSNQSRYFDATTEIPKTYIPIMPQNVDYVMDDQLIEAVVADGLVSNKVTGNASSNFIQALTGGYGTRTNELTGLGGNDTLIGSEQQKPRCQAPDMYIIIQTKTINSFRLTAKSTKNLKT